MEEKLLQPKDLAKICKINKSTLNGYLKDTDAFPPAKIDDNNGYRYYNYSITQKLVLFKIMKKRPFRLKESEIKNIFKKHDYKKLYELYNESSASLQRYLIENKCL